MLFARDHDRCAAASKRLGEALSAKESLTYRQEDQIRFATGELESAMRSLATAWEWIGALSAGACLIVLLTVAFHDSDAGDFGWLVELAGMATVIGGMLLSARITHNAVYDRLRARYWPKPGSIS